MPVSHWLPDKTTKKLLESIKVERFLDIGAGAGKYGKMLQDYHPNAEKIAVEIDSSYIEKYSLTSIYDKVLNISAIKLIDEALDETYDLVVIGDCIEHMRKSEGVDLLNFLIYRCKYILIHYPDRYVQGSVDGHIHEAHISIWSEHDFSGFDYLLIKNGFIHSYAVNGFLQKQSVASKLINKFDKPVQEIFGAAKNSKTTDIDSSD